MKLEDARKMLNSLQAEEGLDKDTLLNLLTELLWAIEDLNESIDRLS